MSVKCFFLEPAGKLRRSLRRFEGGNGACPLPRGYHDASVFIDEIEDTNPHGTYSVDTSIESFADDPRWPTHCACGYGFKDEDQHQVHHERMYKRSDGELETTLRDAPPGAMWFADWMLIEGSNIHRGPDDHCLVVRCPDGHDWMVDARCSNCTLPDDDVHKCWVRHGQVPNITVDKAGLTCNAGAGSIQTPLWHGFLRNGELVE